MSDPNTLIELDTTLDYSSTNEYTSVVIINAIDTNSTALESMNELGHSLNLCGYNTNRGNNTIKVKCIYLVKVRWVMDWLVFIN